MRRRPATDARGTAGPVGTTCAPGSSLGTPRPIRNQRAVRAATGCTGWGRLRPAARPRARWPRGPSVSGAGPRREGSRVDRARRAVV